MKVKSGPPDVADKLRPFTLSPRDMDKGLPPHLKPLPGMQCNQKPKAEPQPLDSSIHQCLEATLEHNSQFLSPSRFGLTHGRIVRDTIFISWRSRDMPPLIPTPIISRFMFGDVGFISASPSDFFLLLLLRSVLVTLPSYLFSNLLHFLQSKTYFWSGHS